MAEYRPNNDRKYRKAHRLHRRYLSYKSTAKTFIRKYAKPEDVHALWNIWMAREQITVDKSTKLTKYEKVLVHKLRINTTKFNKYMQEMANHHFSYRNFKICLDIMGRIEAFGSALIDYDHSQVKFVNHIIDRVNKLELKASKFANKKP